MPLNNTQRFSHRKPFNHSSRFNRVTDILPIQYWTPSDIETALWLDGKDESTITESGGAVSQWDDKSGNGGHAVQATGSQQPTYTTNPKLGDKYGLQFDYLNENNIESPNSSKLNFRYEMTGFIVYSETNDSTNNSILIRISGNSNPSMGISSRNNASPNFGITDSGAAFTSVSIGETGVTEALMLAFGHSISNDEIRISRDGGSFNTLTASPETEVLQDGGGIRIGCQKIGFSRGHDGFIHEVILIEQRLEEKDVQRLEGYLAHKWGLQGELPTDHPFKNSAPKKAVPIAWSPETTETKLWLDASDASTITDSSGSVSQWSDKSGNDANATQSTGSKQPTTGTRTLNGKNVIDFDRANSNNLEIANIPYGTTDEFMIFVVGKIDVRLNYEHFILGRGTDRNGIGLNGSFYRSFVDGNSYTTVTSHGTNPNLFSLCVERGTDAELLLNGTSIDTQTGTYSTTSQQADIGSQTDTYFLDGYIAEIIVTDVCTQIERERFEGYLAHKWGLQDELPVSHPYKDSAPMGFSPEVINYWTPNQITTALWIDSSDDSTITSSGGKVSQMNDKSGNDLHLTQSTEAEKPTTGVETIGGKNALGFDATDDNLERTVATSALTTGDNFSAFFVLKGDTTGGNQYELIDHIGGGRGFSVYRQSTGQTMALRITSDTASNVLASGVMLDGSPHIIQVYANDLKLRGFRKDGVLNGSGSWTGNTFATTSAINNIGKCTDQISEMIIINDDVSTETREKIEGYLAHKWGLEANLDVSHPYKSEPPTV